MKPKLNETNGTGTIREDNKKNALFVLSIFNWLKLDILTALMAVVTCAFHFWILYVIIKFLHG